MGCGPFKNQSTESSVKIVSALSECLVNNIKQIILKVPHRIPCSSFKCRKFKIPEPEPKIFKVELASLYGPELFGSSGFSLTAEQVLTDYKDFISNESFFFSNVHSACMPDFSLETAITVMIITLHLNNIKFSITNIAPFLKTISAEPNKSELLESWKNYIQIVQLLVVKYRSQNFCNDLLTKTDGILKKYKNVKNTNAVKRLKYLAEINGIISKFFNSIKDIWRRVKALIEFYQTVPQLFDKFQFTENLGIEVNCDRVVHECLIKE